MCILLYSITPRIPLGREKGNGKREDRRGMRDDKQLFRKTICFHSNHSLSPLYRTRRGETEHSLSESGHNKSFCKTAMFSFELDLISAISNPKGATECFLSESGRFGITFGCL